MSRILLLGRSGQLGHALAATLAAIGPVHAPPRAIADLGAPETLRAKVLELEPDIIVNAAAYTAVDRAESDIDNAFRINAEGPGVLAECARACGALLVHYSTDYVFDGRSERPYRETDPCAPLSVYGRSKHAGEQAVLDSGASALVLRTSWVYGPIGNNFLLTIRRLARDGRPLRIVDDQRGAPTSTVAIATATADLLRELDPDPARVLGGRAGLYHLSASGSTSWYGFARRILARDPTLATAGDVSITPISTAEYPLPARRPAYSVLDNAAFETTFGIRLDAWETLLDGVLALA